jgi:CRP/FNR family cyclic AMP-dependent transcriptional regulator
MAVPGCAAELVGVPLFARVERAVLESLEPAAFTRRLGRGQVLFVAGEPADNVYLLRSGRLKINVLSARGDELVLAVLGPGDCLGEISILDGGSRSADVVAIEACELVAVPVAAVRDLLQANPEALRGVVVSMAAAIRRLTDQTADLVFLDLPRRLAKLLVRSAAAGPNGSSIAQLGVRQSELAAMLGVTRQSVNKSLSGLARRGWIEVDGSIIRLLDPDALDRFVRS